MAYKLPRPTEDYLVGKYDNGVCCYLITKEAYKTWYDQDVSVKHLCIKNNSGLELVQYSLAGNGHYRAYKLDKVPLDWMKLINKDCPELYEQLFAPKPVVKSEPTPDDYYIIKYNMPTWYIVKRSEYDGGKKEVPAMFWTSKDGKYHAVVGTESAKNNPHKAYKFPQLSSEVKAELQKLNPERYKEWEEFYMNKYPGFKPLNPVQGPKRWFEEIKPKNWMFAFGLHGSLSKDRIYIINSLAKSGGHLGISGINIGTGLNQWVEITDAPHRSFLMFDQLDAGWRAAVIAQAGRAFFDYFDQYYSELEQKNAAKKQYPKIGEYYEIPMEDFEVLAYDSDQPYLLLKSDRAKLGYNENCMVIDLDTLIPGWNSPYLAQPSSYKPSQKFLYVHESWYNLPRIHTEMMKVWDHSSGSEDWTQRIRKYPKATFSTDKLVKHQLGSDLDIDEKAMTEWYVDAIKSWEAPKKVDMYNLPKGLHMGTPFYTTGIDPYQPAKDKSAVSIWGKDLHGKLVNRLTELESEQFYKDYISYWKKHPRIAVLDAADVQGVAWLKPRRVGQTKFYEEVQKVAEYYGRPIPQSEGTMTQINKQYSPNLKQQNDEIINVPRKIITVSSRQECTGNSISSIRRAPTVTEKYTGNRPEPCRGKKSSRGCKIG